MFGAQSATFIATGLAFLAAWHYARIADKQKDVMELQSLIMNQALVTTRQQSLALERGGLDTHALAVAAQTQAEAAKGGECHQYPS